MHHGAGLRRLLVRRALVDQLSTDYRAAQLSAADRAMLDYAVKLTHHPGSMSVDDVEALQRHGFEDRAILDICQVTGYYNFVNRLANGLGVELEPYWGEDAG